MKKIYLFLFNFFVLIYMESLYGLIVFDSYLRSTIIFVFLFLIPVALFNTIIISVFNKKINFILGNIIYSVLGIYFSLQLVFKQVFNTYFQVSLFSLGNQLTSFGKETFMAIFSNLHYILLFLIPLIIFILLRKKLDLNRFKLNLGIIFSSICIILFGLIFVCTKFIISEDNNIHKIIYKLNNNSQSIQNVGILQSAILDIGKTITGFEEEIIINDDIIKLQNNDDEIFEYDYNNLELDFSRGNNSTINDYMENDSGTKKNEYTGIFEGKNLIYIVAESFHTIGVSKELTPTLYNLINDGFVFENFYVPNNLSTIGGEFQAITGLYPDNTILSTWRSGKNYFPYGLANKFKEYGYNTYAYHNNSYTFQNRYQYLKSQGFDNFKGCKNGMEKLINCDAWPQSDLEMIDKTIDEYIGKKPFLTYYMTVSGHFGYTKDGSSIVRKNYELVKDLDYSEKVKGYIASQIELDKALELLIERLEEKNIIDDTVIVMLADHYPYDLNIDEVNEVSTYKRDDNIEVNHNNLIIWNNKLKAKKVEKVSMSIDVLPTVYNLFGIEYDSRLLIGKDIFSNSEGIAIMKDRSWITNKGTYNSGKNEFIPKEKDVSDEYISSINQIVNNRLNISKMIISNNYYKSIKK